MTCKAWDKNQHRQMIVPVNELLSYIEETRKLADLFPAIQNDVLSDTHADTCAWPAAPP